MLTKREVKNIQSQMTNELNATPRIVLVCTLMLALLFGLAWLGVAGDEVATLVTIFGAR